MVESPHEKGVFYTGSDDGLVHITQDNGENWKNITPKGLEECLINAIEVSPHDPSTAYIATTRYKFNDYTPALYKTTDYGKSWKNISTGIPYGAYTRVVREDENRKNLLYAGTETGVFISWNGGAKWESLQLNLPITPITDLNVHQGDLVVATSGRSFWVLDDIGTLGQYDSKSGTKIYSPEDAIYGSWGSPLSGNSASFTGSNTFTGVNPANGVVIYYELPDLADSVHVILTITNESGKKIRVLTSEKPKNFKRWDGGPPKPSILSKQKGLNRFVWNMRAETMPGIENTYLEGSYRGHKLSPGEYQLTLEVGNEEYTSSATILNNPQFEVSKGQYEDYDQFMSAAETSLTEMHDLVNRLKTIQKKIKKVIETIKDEELKKNGDALAAALEEWDNDMVQRKSKAYDDVENFPNKFTAEYLFMINATESSIPRVNQSSIDLKKELDTIWVKHKAQAEGWMKNELPAYNKKLWEAGIGALELD